MNLVKTQVTPNAFFKSAANWQLVFLLLMLTSGYLSIAVSQITLALALLVMLYRWIFLKEAPPVTGLEKTAALLRGIPCKINLIPYNPGGSGVNLESKVLLAAKRLNAPPREWGFETPAEPEVEAFCEYLHSRGYTVIIRWSKGREIKSACGQLATEI